MALNAPSELSVTEVRNALRCPRVFALGRARGKAVVFPVGASSLGATFHRIAELFAGGVEAPPDHVKRLPRGAPRETVASALGAWLLGHLVDALERSPDLASMPGEVDDLAEALRELGRYLAAEMEGSDSAPAEALRAQILHAELAVEAVIASPAGVPVRVAGRVDAVHGRAAGAIDVVEYKLTDEANQELDQAQVALYRRLLRDGLDVDAEPVILRFNPGLIATRLSPAASDAIVERRILPLLGEMVGWAEHPLRAPPTLRRDLCAACPVRVACAETYADRLDPRDLPPAGAARPRPDPEGLLGVTPAAEPARAGPCRRRGAARARRAREADRRRAAQARRDRAGGAARRGADPAPPGGDDLPAARGAARPAGGGRGAPPRGARGALREGRGEARLHRAAEAAARGGPRRCCSRRRPRSSARGRGASCWAKGSTARWSTGDLSDGSTCHLLVGGQTGSGKCVLLRAIVGSLCHFHPPSAIRFTLVDPKRVTFGKLASAIAAHLEGPIFHDAEALLPELDDLVAEMEARYERFDARQGAGHRRLQRGRPPSASRAAWWWWTSSAICSPTRPRARPSSTA